MEVNFGRSVPFSIGVEEEFQLLSPESYELVSRFDEVAEAARDERVKPELLQSVLEVATSVGRNVPEAIEEARELRTRLRDAAAERGTLIASAGTHPFSRYEHQDVTEAPRYVGLVEKMQWIAERELIFGLHVHVGMRSGDEAIQVANALRTWLPELLALSANSPFWHGRDTGLASTRIKVFDPFPRSGLPPTFASFADFEALVERAGSRRTRSPTTRTSGGTCAHIRGSGRSRSGSATRRRGSTPSPRSSPSSRASPRRSPSATTARGTCRPSRSRSSRRTSGARRATASTPT
jgi:YbdK family carboxylate-amine ligase